MCGIAGILRFDGHPVQQKELTSILDRLAHRGQNHCGMIFESSGGNDGAKDLALGHRRLSIIDLSESASQPMTYEHGRLALTFNGEIYNYIELREELKGFGYSFKTNSDSEVILAAYSKWGASCVEHFNGMFAFAIWDNTLKKLFCARDHLGIKPFYYFKSKECIAIASESRALKYLHQNMLDSDALASYLLGLYIPSTWSIFKGVSKLLPGHTMIVDSLGHVDVRRFWNIKKTGDRSDSLESRGDLKNCLKHAVSLQLRSDVPVGALLSGGVDSAMVVSLAAEQGAKLHTYSIGFEGQQISELGAAKQIAKNIHSIHHEAFISAGDSISCLDVSLRRLTEPIADPAIVPSYLLSQMASADGVKVLLSGAGGDEIFGGYERYAGNANYRRWLLAQAPESLRVIIGGLLPKHSKLSVRLKNVALDMLFNTGGDFDLCSAMQGDDTLLKSFLGRLVDVLPLMESSGHCPLLYKQMGFDMSVYMPDEILLLFDQMTMAHTIEGRVPLIDVNVVESAFRFPASSHVKGNRTKVLFRQIASEYLGDDYVWRKKQGFAGPVPWWVGNNLKLFIGTALAVTELPGMQSLRPIISAIAEKQAELLRAEANILFTLYCLKGWYDSLD